MQIQQVVTADSEPTAPHWVFCTNKKNNPVKHIDVCLACWRRKNCKDLRDHQEMYGGNDG